MINTKKSTTDFHLLWTGGWDSTFRLLQIVLEEKKSVQPYYVIDPLRKSSGIEIYTQHSIKKALFTSFPETQTLIRPTKYINRELIDPDKEITAAWTSLNEYFHVGTQYEWLPRLCKQLDVNKMEISLFKYPKPDSESTFRKHYLIFFDQRNSNMILEKTDPITQKLDIMFKRIYSPITHLTKPEMLTHAKEKRWMNVMELTRFCHRPDIKIKPCGVCIPCNLALEDGMSHRIPFSGRVNRWVRSIKKVIRERFLSHS